MRRLTASPAPGPTVLVCVDLAMVATEKTSKPWEPSPAPTVILRRFTSEALINEKPVPCPWGEAPKKCSTFLGGFSHKIIITSTTPNVTPEFSSDLERAPGARSIADENSGVTFGVVELRRCEAYEHFRSHPVLLGTLPYGSSRVTPHISGQIAQGSSLPAPTLRIEESGARVGLRRLQAVPAADAGCARRAQENAAGVVAVSTRRCGGRRARPSQDRGRSS